MSQWYAKMACVNFLYVIYIICIRVYTFIYMLYVQHEKGLLKRKWGRVTAKKLNDSNVLVLHQ